MAKLNQIIAIVQGKKTRAIKLLTDAHRGWNKDRISGINRTYAPVEEDGEVFPAEHRAVQLRVVDAIQTITKEIAGFYDTIATLDLSNTAAMADVVVDDAVIVADVPITTLLFLEKQMTDLRTFAGNIPTLPTDRIWSEDAAKNCWVTEPEQTVKTHKKVEVLVKYEATKEHPAQTECIGVDRTIGHWETVHMSGAIPEKTKAQIVSRIEKFQDALKMAREKANSIEAVSAENLGKKIMDNIFGD